MWWQKLTVILVLGSGIWYMLGQGIISLYKRLFLGYNTGKTNE
jgi:hypothetical protein